MAKMTVRSGAAAPAPSAPETEIADPNVFVDARGRRIRVRDLSVLEQMRLLRLVGGENSAYYNFCLRLARVAQIGEDILPVPDKNVLFEAVAQRLGDDGLYALTVFFLPKEETVEDETKDDATLKAEAAAEVQKERDLVKNS